VRIEPMFRITPESLDAVDVRPSSGAAAFLTENNMAAANGQRRVSVPVVRTVQTARPLALAGQADNLGSATALNREDPDLPIVPENAQHDELAGGAPTPLARAVSAKHSLIAFHGTIKRLPALFPIRERCPDETEETLNSPPVYVWSQPEVGWHPKPSSRCSADQSSGI